MKEIELKINDIGDKFYYIKGTNILHREDGPAIEWINGDRSWYQNNKLHREDGPACEINGNKYWYKNNKLHREDGPAMEYIDGDRSWCQNDLLHRIDGPAIEYKNGSKEYWINGKKIPFFGTNEEWIIKVLLE